MTTTVTTSAPPRIDAAVVRGLLETQFPGAEKLGLGERYEGRDSVVWRIGHDWAVRLPRSAKAAARQATETQWLGRLSADWPFAAPVPVRVGKPSITYPYQWTVVPWLPGRAALDAPIGPEAASDLGTALRALHTPAPAEAPRHAIRSLTLMQRADRFAQRVDALAATAADHDWVIHADRAKRIFERGAAATRPAATWCHLDLNAGNVIVDGARLVGLVDWSDAAAADPAVDLGQALTLLPATSWDGLVVSYGLYDAKTLTRARAEALYYSTTLAARDTVQLRRSAWSALEALGVAERT